MPLIYLSFMQLLKEKLLVGKIGLGLVKGFEVSRLVSEQAV